MGKIVKRIVLTGGPSSGKSSSLKTIKKYFEDNSYKVFVIGESATEIMSSGIEPDLNNRNSMINFQDIILKYQLFKENLVIDAITNLPKEDEAIIIYDRGLLDNKAYIEDEEFTELLNKYNLKEMDLLNRYDLVIHLETGAKSKFYRTDNNEYRRESKEEAIEKDNKTFEAWKQHRNLHRVKCFEDFEKKQREIIKLCENSLRINRRKQYKFVASLDLLKHTIDLNSVLIKQYYIDNHDKYEHRLRKISNDNQTIYTYTIQEKLGNGESNIIEDIVIDEKLFNMKLASSDILNIINKKRYYVTVDGVLIYVDVFKDGRVIVESNSKEFDYEKFNILEEVTGDDKYLNINLLSMDKKIELVNS